MAPPGVPAGPVKVLRDAFNAALHDQEFLIDAEKLRLEVVPQTREGVQRVVESAYASPANVIARLKQIVGTVCPG